MCGICGELRFDDRDADLVTIQKISREMKIRGFTFFGPTICYAHMQATGMVNDHVSKCFRYKELGGI